MRLAAGMSAASSDFYLFAYPGAHNLKGFSDYTRKKQPELFPVSLIQMPGSG